MNKILAILLVLVMMSSNAGAYADQAETITFRDIPWYSKEPDVDATIKSIDGVSTPWFMATTTGTKIDGWYKQYEYFYTDNAVDNGGDIYRYDDISVAGYTADLEVSFMYPVIDGVVTYDSSLAEFYMAIYEIEGLEEMQAVYEDLQMKLAGIYGPYTDNSYYDSFDNVYDPLGCIFEAKDGSMIWLAARYNSISDKYDTVDITYYAPDADQRLADLEATMTQNTIDAEAAEREANAGNTSGL